MKRIIAILVSLCMVCSISTISCFAENSDIENGENNISVIIAELKERGFTEEFLADFLDEELREMHRDSEGYVVYISEDENSGIQLLNNDIPEEHLDFSLSVAYYAKQGSANTIDHVVIYCRYEWLIDSDSSSNFYHPEIRSTDGITINWDHTVFTIADTGPEFIFRPYKKLNSASTWTLIDTIKRPGKSGNGGGLGFTFDLDNSASYAHRGVASFELYPTDGDKTFYVSGSGAPSYMTVSGEYAHSREENFPVTLSATAFGVTVAAADVSPSTAAAHTAVKYYKNP